ncbi:MAG: TonB-dependent receptor [Bacteroidales bacterium]|nr:TonB-dependent receptor [Bacteroidales bacterium]
MNLPLSRTIFLGLCGLCFTILPSRAAEPTDTLASERALETVVCTGTNNPIRPALLSYTVTVIDRAQLEASGKTQLLSAINGEVPSLFVSERNIYGFGVSTGGSGGIKIRGIGGSPTNAVLMMVDGQPQFAGIYSHHVADIYGTEEVDHVEVLRGPGSVLYGSNAMGGVINVITRTPHSDGTHLQLTSQLGSRATWRSNLQLTARYGRLSALISGSYDRTDGLEPHFDFKQASGYAKLIYQLSRSWKVAADYALMNFKGNDPVYARLSNPESTDIYHQDVTRGEASLAISDTYSATTSGTLRVYYSYGNHFVDDPRHFHSLDDRFGILAYQNFAPWAAAIATVGFDYNYYTGKIPVSGGTQHTPGSISTMGRRNICEYSPYVSLQQSLWGERMTLNAGLRMANADKFSPQWIPQGGIVVNPGGGWLVKASVSKGYRNPSFREMYLYKPANPDLKPERMINYEATIGRQWLPWLGVDLTGYYSRGSNMIQTVDMKNVNTGRFINKGIEVAARSNPLSWLSLRATYSYLHTTLSNLTGAPRNQWFLGASLIPIKGLSIDTSVRYVGSLFVSEGLDRETYAIWDLGVRYRCLSWLELLANLNNLTDARYEIQRGYRMPGFNYSFGLRLSF